MTDGQVSKDTALRCQECGEEFIGRADYIEDRLPGIGGTINHKFNGTDESCPACGASEISPMND